MESATWLHKAQSLPKEQFRAEVERELTGRDAEPSELIYFKVYKSQQQVIEQALDTAALMLGSDKSRGYCLEMICADFLAGAHIENGNPKILLFSMLRVLCGAHRPVGDHVEKPQLVDFAKVNVDGQFDEGPGALLLLGAWFLEVS